MEVIIILAFVSLLLVAGGLLMFTYELRQGDLDHGDRLTLLPLDDGPPPSPASTANPPSSQPGDPGKS